MSLEFNNPLYIGDKDSALKADVSQLQQDVGDLSQLETADKSSLVNALNEALDSTLNGASRDLDNLSDTGNARLHALKAYADEGELLTDTDGLSFVKSYAHSTFDLSKFTVVGSPNITDDGIASGFSKSNYIKLNLTLNDLKDKSWEIETPIYSYKGGNTYSHFWAFFSASSCLSYSFSAGNIQFISTFGDSDSSSPTATVISKVISINQVESLQLKLNFNITTGKYSLYGKVNNGDYELYGEYTPTTDNKQIASIFQHSDANITIGSNGATNVFVTDLKTCKVKINGVEVFSGNKTGIDTIKADDYTVVGTPTISDDGVASGFSSSNYINAFNYNQLLNHSWKLQSNFRKNTSQNNCCLQTFVYWVSSGGLQSYNGSRLSLLGIFGADDDKTGENQGTNVSLSSFAEGQLVNYSLGFNYSTGQYTLKVWGDNVDVISNTYTPPTANKQLNCIINSTSNSVIRLGSASGSFQSSSIDLNAFKIYVDGNLVYQPCLKIPYTESKTGSKIVDSIYRDRVNDMAEQFGFANYYTLDEDNGNFTLPQVELYGLIGQRTLRDSYRNGATYWELWSDRTLEIGGSCTSGVEYNLPRSFTSENDYVLSVPYSAKTASSFTPTVSGDFIAKGLGVL